MLIKSICFHRGSFWLSMRSFLKWSMVIKDALKSARKRNLLISNRCGCAKIPTKVFLTIAQFMVSTSWIKELAKFPFNAFSAWIWYKISTLPCWSEQSEWASLWMEWASITKQNAERVSKVSLVISGLMSGTRLIGSGFVCYQVMKPIWQLLLDGFSSVHQVRNIQFL